MKISRIAAVALATLTGACASIVEGTTQDVAVTTASAAGAACTLQNSEGTWYVTTPGNAHVHKTKNDLNVTCKKDGYADASLTVAPHFNGATAGNILAGGVIGIGIDAATGANYNYPTAIDIPMKVVDASAPAKSPVPATATTTTPTPAQTSSTGGSSGLSGASAAPVH